jgi:acyl-CoA synthetase (AMP-forming)/AMP-acid ligase II
MVGQLPLEQHIGVRIPGGQPGSIRSGFRVSMAQFSSPRICSDRMQPYSLTVDKFLEHAAKWSGDRETVTAEAKRSTMRADYAGLMARSNRLSGALRALGIGFGHRIGTFGWNTQHHLEMYYALAGAGLVCHTLNTRVAVAHLASMINEAEDRALAVASDRYRW